MRNRFETPSRGLSLLEVVVSIALMGGILVSMLVAHSRLVRQSNRAELVRAASTLSDDLLADWFVEDTMPLVGSGVFENSSSFRWATSIVRTVPNMPTDAVVVNFQVYGNNHGKEELLFETELLTENPRR